MMKALVIALAVCLFVVGLAAYVVLDDSRMEARFNDETFDRERS